MNSLARLVLIIACMGIFLPGVAVGEEDPGFSAWVEGFRTEARAAGISPQTLEAALAGLERPLPRVIEFDRKQPETVQTLQEYVTARVSDKRITAGREMLSRYATWLGRVEAKYGVNRHILVALWGIESRYGEHAGTFSVIQALATLAYEGRRGAYFRKELLDALRILDAGHIPLERMKGSWAGAMGQCQFMPSSYLRNAVDADGDGRADIWQSVPDVLASSANYLARAGWNRNQIWGRPVRLPPGFDLSLAGLGTSLPLSRWQHLGVRRGDGGPLPTASFNASLIAPDGPEGPAFLVYDNFRVLLSWNRSHSFAVAVGSLADRLAGKKDSLRQALPRRRAPE